MQKPPGSFRPLVLQVGVVQHPGAVGEEGDLPWLGPPVRVVAMDHRAVDHRAVDHSGTVVVGFHASADVFLSFGDGARMRNHTAVVFCLISIHFLLALDRGTHKCDGIVVIFSCLVVLVHVFLLPFAHRKHAQDLGRLQDFAVWGTHLGIDQLACFQNYYS
jgi:hypothetical protein